MYWPFRSGSTGVIGAPFSVDLGAPATGWMFAGSGEKLLENAVCSPPNVRMLMSSGMFS